MTVATRETGWMDSYRKICTLLQGMTKKELDELVDTMENQKKVVREEEAKRYHPLTEKEFFAEVDESLAQYKRGEYRLAEEFEAEYGAKLKAKITALKKAAETA